MGSHLIFEESFCIGFLPLRSYFEQRKQVGNGQRCPEDKEELVRCIIQVQCLEYLNCTANRKEVPELDNVVDDPDDIFAQLDDLD